MGDYYEDANKYRRGYWGIKNELNYYKNMVIEKSREIDNLKKENKELKKLKGILVKKHTPCANEINYGNCSNKHCSGYLHQDEIIDYIENIFNGVGGRADMIQNVRNMNRNKSYLIGRYENFVNEYLRSQERNPIYINPDY